MQACTWHIPAHVQPAHWPYVSDVNQEAAEAIAAELGARAVGIDEAIGAADVDAVVICTPTDTHAELIDRAAAAGKAIFCEKPIDMDAARIRRSLDGVAQRGVKLMIGFNRRFDPSFAALKTRLDSGEIGAVELVTILSRDPAPPPVEYIKRSGGLFRDMMIHDLDMARFLLGEEPVSVYALGLGAGRSGHRRGGRCGHSRLCAEDRVRQAGADLQFAPRRLWLRPAHRGAWGQGDAGGGQSHRHHGDGRRPRKAMPPIRRCPSSWSAMPRLIAPKCPASSMP